ncbi:MAG: c-type cytochrome domain-containing protein, partial [Phycisphaerae bacterium]
MTMPRVALGLFCALALLAGSARGNPGSPAPTADQIRFFEMKVRPLLVEACMSCHGPQKQKGGLRLDSAEWLAKGGKNGPVLVPGKPAESKLLLAVAYKDEDLQMPPDEKLPADKVAILTQWVEMGAPFPLASQPVTVSRHKKRTIRDDDRQFWAFQPVVNPAAPAVKDAAWAKNEVDRFVLAKLEAEGLTPAPEADKRTLVRRAYF